MKQFIYDNFRVIMKTIAITALVALGVSVFLAIKVGSEANNIAYGFKNPLRLYTIFASLIVCLISIGSIVKYKG